MQYAFANEGGSLTQDLSTPLLANTTYTFTMWELGGATGTAELVAGGTDVLADATGAVPAPEAWGQFTLTYTSPGSGSPIGEDLSVVLTSTGTQGDFDALSDITTTTTTTVPEPSTMVLLGTGVLALGGARRRRAR